MARGHSDLASIDPLVDKAFGGLVEISVYSTGGLFDAECSGVKG
jgi:hypothetical protein